MTSNVFGALVDVSGSIEGCSGGNINVQDKWSKSIFQVIDDLINNDVSPENRIFSVAIGAKYGKGTFDILSTLKKVQDNVAKIEEMKSKRFTLPLVVLEILIILECNGARYIRKWVDMLTLLRVIDKHDACSLLFALRQSINLSRNIVDHCLPPACKDWNSSSGIKTLFQGVYTSVVTSFRQASQEEIKEVIEKAKKLIHAHFEMIEELQTYSVHDARKIIHGVKGDTEMTNKRANELMDAVKPFIYGPKPLYTSLEDVSSLFCRYDVSTKYSRVLVVVSDGKPSDHGNILWFARQLKAQKVTVVSCFISNTEDIEPRRLYSSKQIGWTEGANLLFDLSSPIPTQIVPRTILLKQNWDIDIEDNETKLFLQVNDPENVHDICDLAHKAVCSQDTLAELLVSAALDIAIYMDASDMTPFDQGSEQVCYAIASATVLHLSMKRILGRHGGYPDLSDLRKEIVDKHGFNEANTFQVLSEICPRYRLRCDDDVGVVGALEAIRERRPVVATFKLTDTQWRMFRRFFKKTPNGILKLKDIATLDFFGPQRGHAVVLTSFTSKGLTFMNSWGTEWANRGFFTIENAEVLNCKFIDVYWKEKDLFESEKKYYMQHGAKVASDLMAKLIGLQSSTYTCEMCGISSKVTEFTGTLSEAVCPRCSKRFEVGYGNILALNMYLLALSSI